MKRLAIFSWLLFFAICLFSPVNVFAQVNEEPIITIHSTAYQEVGEGNKFSIFLGTFTTDYYDIDMGAGLNEVEIEPGTIDTESGSWEGTWIPARATQEGIIKIYGDPKNIDIIAIDGAYIESIEMSQCVNLEVISLQHNVLENLDLSPFTNAFAIYLTDNPFTGSQSLVVGAPKPYLAILEIDNIQKIDQSLDLRNYPNLRVFDAYYNFGLQSVDTSECPFLQSLVLEMTAVDKLDVSANTELINLNIGETRITNLDISNNTKLKMLLAGHDSGWINKGYKLESIDLTSNPELTYLNLNGNGFDSVDLSNNTLLTHLMLSNNNLTHLDLSLNTELYSVSIINNDLCFATLPLPMPTWGEYWYKQRPISVAKELGVGQPLDLSDKVLREGTTTDAYVWCTPYDDHAYLLDEAAYSYADGIVSFNRAVTDSVYVEFVNDVFNEYSMSSSKFLVKNVDDLGKPAKIISLSMATPLQGNIRFAVGLSEASVDAPRKFLVDFGDGDLKEFSSSFSDKGDAANVDVPAPAGFTGAVSIYIPEGEVMTSFELTSQPLYSINLTAATELRYLNLSGCDLYNIDLRYNRCLRTLDVSHNNLYQLDLMGIFGNYQKYVLETIIASHNNISSFDSFKFADANTFTHIDFSYNALEDFTLLEFENLEYVDLSHNNISGELYLTYQIDSKHIDLSHNNISSFVIDHFSQLEYFNVADNDLSLATLPLPEVVGSAEYIYAPQLKYVLPKNAPAVNLSAQNRVVDGVGTSFVWMDTDGKVLVNGVDVECTDGATRFLNFDYDAVYCVMTNPAFPEFAGDNVYSTTEVHPVAAPQHVVASFTTLEDSDNANVIFTGSQLTSLLIDWRGDGSEYTEYPVATSYISYPDQHTYAGAHVKVYTYDSPELITVFSLNDMLLGDIDASPLVNVFAFSLNETGLSAENIKLPDEAPVTELSLSGNKLVEYPFADKYPKVFSLNLSNNLIESFDASVVPNVQFMSLDNNLISEIKFDNPVLWGLGISGNQLESIDLNGLPAIEQIGLDNNLLSSIDLDPVKNSLIALSIQGNRFNFSTLPIQSDYPKLSMLYYAGQADIVAECVDGKVDLSATAFAGDTPTQYTWYLGEAVYDEENAVWLGETLIEGEEFVVNDGVTTFLYDFDEPVMCLMTNEVFPSLTLKSNLIKVSNAGIVAVADDAALINVYNISGVLVKANVPANEALIGLAPGFYIANGKKVLVK